MSRLAFLARERWFEVGLRFFAAGALVALAAALVSWLPQLRALALIALAQAALGAAVCAWGLRETQPARWKQLRERTRSFGDRLRRSPESGFRVA
jgi:hypothetical protein